MGKFSQFLIGEIRQRDMSARQFAEYVGVSHQTINKFIAENGDAGQPSIDLLVKISKATGAEYHTKLLTTQYLLCYSLSHDINT